MLVPKKLKYRKPHRGRMRGQARGGTEVQFGEHGLQALEPSWITNRQIEAARIAMTRKIKRRRNPHGLGPGLPRGLRGGRQAGPRDVRDERRRRAAGARRYDARRAEAAD